MARILILGGGGRLGAAVARHLRLRNDVAAPGRAEADLADPAAVAALVRSLRPDAVLNCAALTDVDRCEREPGTARLVNSDAPGEIARAAGESGARCVHISTDYVFDGRSARPYAEDDPPAPLSVYGRTKRDGEQAVLAAEAAHAVVRVAWVFGPDRDSFVDKALHAAIRGEGPVRAVADKFSSPTYTLDAAPALERLLGVADAPGGIYHLCNRGVCSWRDWAQEAVDAARDLGVAIKEANVEPIRLADLDLMVAPRPIHTAMSCERLEAVLGRPFRPWQDAVRDYVRLLRDEGRLRPAGPA